MQKSFLPDEEKTWSDKEIVLQKDAENTMDGTCKQRGIFKENGNEKDTCS